jgi:hypothetical protein
LGLSLTQRSGLLLVAAWAARQVGRQSGRWPDGPAAKHLIRRPEMTARLLVVVVGCSGNVDRDWLAEKQEPVGDDLFAVTELISQPCLPIELSREDVDVGGECLPREVVAAAGEQLPSSCLDSW